MSKDTEPTTTPTLYSVKQLAAAEPALSVGGLREDLFHRHTNGLEASGAVIRRGRRLLLHRERYMAWLIDGRASLRGGERMRKAA
ncbi:hypothetical protein [Thiobaca trueperi]|uniref:Uncharacterized protein n=1 Tax=Thiobaca trueperi TaxID=127458 RepID=A0A4R3N0Y7_9GAMM|nr:hypothetical protein [Thiobaca trueperi]TCT20279.1 hypothetical protein EDC35_106206 [Thiobaca trueperi]